MYKWLCEKMTLITLLIYYFVGVIFCHPSSSNSKQPGEENDDLYSDTPNIESMTAILKTTSDNVADIHLMLKEEAKRYFSKNNPYHLTYQAGMDAAGKILIPEIARLRTEFVSLHTDLAAVKKKRIKILIVPKLQDEVVEYEQKYLPSIKLDKSSMIEAVNRKDPKFAIPESIVKAYNRDLPLHYLRWQYILNFCTHPDIQELRTFLAEHYPTISNEAIAKTLAMFFEKRSDKILCDAMAGLTGGDIEEGLIANGLQDRDMIAVIKALIFIPKGRKYEIFTRSE